MYRILFKSLLKVRTEIMSNGTSTDIKDSKFVDHLYIDGPVAKQQYASKADVVRLSYED